MRAVKFRRFDMRSDDDQPTFWERVENGAWEPGTLAVMDRHVGPATLFVDLGAWVGPTTLYAAALGATVVAVEADPAALDQLRRNLAVNPYLADLVTVVPRAIHATEGCVRFGARRKPGDSMSSVLLADSATTWNAPTITPGGLAGMLPEGLAPFVKIDIEGGEFDLLPVLGPLLDRPGTRALVSFHPAILAASICSGEAGRDILVAGTQAALAIFAGWRSFPVRTQREPERTPDAAAIAAGIASDEWLFVRS